VRRACCCCCGTLWWWCIAAIEGSTLSTQHPATPRQPVLNHARLHAGEAAKYMVRQQYHQHREGLFPQWRHAFWSTKAAGEHGRPPHPPPFRRLLPAACASPNVLCRTTGGYCSTQPATAAALPSLPQPLLLVRLPCITQRAPLWLGSCTQPAVSVASDAAAPQVATCGRCTTSNSCTASTSRPSTPLRSCWQPTQLSLCAHRPTNPPSEPSGGRLAACSARMPTAATHLAAHSTRGQQCLATMAGHLPARQPYKGGGINMDGGMPPLSSTALHLLASCDPCTPGAPAPDFLRPLAV